MSVENGKAANGWKVAGLLWGIVTALFLLLYTDARGDINDLKAEIRGISTVNERLARVEEKVGAIDSRTLSIERKLDTALDRNPYTSRPGPR